jgi:hypothetical protein
MNRGYSFLDYFYLDLRSLSFFRIGLGLILIYDLIHRARYLTMHYSNQGVLPIKLLKSGIWEPGYWSIYTLSGSAEFQIVLFIIYGLAALGLLFGFKTKVSTILCWVLTLSLQNRNPWILNSGDTYLRMLLFWDMFLPLGRMYSIDNWHIAKPKNFRYASIASLCLIVQIMLVYVMTGLLKDSAEWLWNGTAIYYALNLNQMVKPLGHYLLHFPALLKIMTHSTTVLELIFPFLFIFPFKNSLVRTVAIFSFALFHIGIFATMKIGIFSGVTLVALVALIPTPVITKCSTFLRRKWPAKAKMLFDKQPTASKALQSSSDKQWLQKTKMGVCTLLLSFVLFWNIMHFFTEKKKLPESVRTFANVLRINQYWRMFAPRVYKRDGWFIAEGRLSNYKDVDLFHQEKTIQRTEPNNLLAYYKCERWRKYFENLIRADKKKYYRALASALITKWNRTHDETVDKFTFTYMAEFTLPPDKKQTIEKQKLFEEYYHTKNITTSSSF